jgi:hypothetical protein
MRSLLKHQRELGTASLTQFHTRPFRPGDDATAKDSAARQALLKRRDAGTPSILSGPPGKILMPEGPAPGLTLHNLDHPAPGIIAWHGP